MFIPVSHCIKRGFSPKIKNQWLSPMQFFALYALLHAHSTVWFNFDVLGYHFGIFKQHTSHPQTVCVFVVSAQLHKLWWV